MKKELALLFLDILGYQLCCYLYTLESQHENLFFGFMNLFLILACRRIWIFIKRILADSKKEIRLHSLQRQEFLRQETEKVFLMSRILFSSSIFTLCVQTA